jgi:hypothetical protein
MHGTGYREQGSRYRVQGASRCGASVDAVELVHAPGGFGGGAGGGDAPDSLDGEYLRFGQCPGVTSKAQVLFLKSVGKPDLILAGWDLAVALLG